MQNSTEINAKTKTACIIYRKLEILGISKGKRGEWDWSRIYRRLNSKILEFSKT